MEAMKTPFNKTQLEIMALLSQIKTGEELAELKAAIAHHYAEKVQKETDRIWEERGYTQATMEAWLKEPT